MLAPDKTGFPADSDFITDDKGRKVFRNIARLSKKRVAVVADVAYEVSEGIPNRLPERHRRRVDSDPGRQALWHSNRPHPAPAEAARGGST